MITDPIIEALAKYGVDHRMTPRTITMDWSRDGITIDQFESDPDAPDLVRIDGMGESARPVLVRRFFPHPPSP